uniref:Uncharacterized protein n=1 Tax=Timema monikensis TaxID=170555 RepID=A0A7R9E5R2_9NEOP|nr:unnamed protein product [Timema monikensis]
MAIKPLPVTYHPPDLSCAFILAACVLRVPLNTIGCYDVILRRNQKGRAESVLDLWKSSATNVGFIKITSYRITQPPSTRRNIQYNPTNDTLCTEPISHHACQWITIYHTQNIEHLHQFHCLHHPFLQNSGGHLRLLMMTRKPCSVYRNVSVVLANPTFLTYLSEKLVDLEANIFVGCC